MSYSTRSKSSRKQTPASTQTVIWITVGAFVLLALCCGCWFAFAPLMRSVTQPAAQQVALPSADLTIAYSPEKAELFKSLVDSFNAQGNKASGGTPLVVKTVELEPDAMVAAAVAGNFQAMSPDSSIWLGQVDRAWADAHNGEGTLVGTTARYAVSPVVIAMWRDAAQSMGYPDKTLGWSDLLAKAQSDKNFKWSHPSTTSASGLLATLAEFYAGAGKTRGLTVDDVQAQRTLDTVNAIEKTVRYYGEGEWPIAQRVVQEGRTYLDAFVCSEQIVIWARGKGADLVAIYPSEGATWEDHPLALLEQPGLTDAQRLTFARFADFVRSTESQNKVLSLGYRPADLNVPINSPGSPIRVDNGVDPAQPKTSLQVPAPVVLEAVQKNWAQAKRHTNVMLVVDTSGSMEGDKITNVKQALKIFIEQIQNDQERVGVVLFSSTPYTTIAPKELQTSRAVLNSTIDNIRVGGNTALLDAVRAAYNQLQTLNDKDRINAIVVMTDGLENNSSITLTKLSEYMRNTNQSGVPVMVFAIGYGKDADYKTLKTLADATGGQAREGTLETIRQLYKLLSTYF
jgi:Ca-activated chloride channel family protein